eukprot:TRINITY_DN27280_c0_g1_i4.p1 TRINITY_DN27280_c0_g1~~TRINITY_DN27280_c0_g1_i4.p1  ORF type:complete len:263 (+),score=32.32 TRINITY_DN27280_c0_g1_i4:219-1007(+)
MRVAVYSQPAELGGMGRVAYTDHMQAAFAVPSGNMVGSPTGVTAGRASSGPSSPPRGFRGTPDNAKTKICMRWMAGDCRFGEHCNFAHGEAELRTPPPRDTVMQPFPKQAGCYVVDPYSMRPTPFAHPSAGFPASMYMVSPQHSQSPPIGGHPIFMKTGMRTPSMDTLVAVSPAPSTSINTSFSAPSHYGPFTAAGKPAEMSMEVWTASGCPVAGTNGWCKYTTPEGDDYYHNFSSGITQWEEPSEFMTQTQPVFTSTPVKS